MTIAQGRIMNLVSTTLSLQMALLAIAVAAPGPVQSAETATVSQHDLQAKLVYCKTCHGLAAEGYRGSVPMPRLAGQQREYLENQSGGDGPCEKPGTSAKAAVFAGLEPELSDGRCAQSKTYRIGYHSRVCIRDRRLEARRDFGPRQSGRRLPS